MRPGRLFGFGLVPVISLYNIKSPKPMCRMRAGTKSMTGKRAEGLARGVSKRALAAGAGGILRTGVISSQTELLTTFLVFINMCDREFFNDVNLYQIKNQA
jgi:hypothetical protein